MYPGKQEVCAFRSGRSSYFTAYFPLVVHSSQSLRMRSVLLMKNAPLKMNRRFSVCCSEQLQSNYLNDEAVSSESSKIEHTPLEPEDGINVLASLDGSNCHTLQMRPKRFKNRFLNFVHLGSLVNGAAESFFKSEIRRRLFVTAVLILVSRVGYFIPLPGFDRRLIPADYLSFVSGSVGKF